MVEVRDMDRAVAFYRDVLGFEIGYQSVHWTGMQIGSATLGLHSLMGERAQHPEIPTVGGWILGYSVANLVELKVKLVEAGAKILQDFHDVPGGVVILFLDPDGNAVQVIQRGITVAELGPH